MLMTEHYLPTEYELQNVPRENTHKRFQGKVQVKKHYRFIRFKVTEADEI